MLDEKAIDIDKSEWKKKELGHVTGEGVQKTRGSNREVYEHRLEAQYEHVCHEAAEEAERLWKQFEFAGLFLVGPDRLVGLIKSKIAQPFSPLVFSDPEDLGKFSPQAILRRLEPLVSKIEQKRQMAVVEQLLGDEGKLVVNPDEVFAQLQDGTIHTVVVASDGNLTLRECVKCGLASRSADPACSGCGGELRNVSLLEILPGLAATHHIKVEFVSGEAAKLLAKAGGIGGWSRQPSLRAAG